VFIGAIKFKFGSIHAVRVPKECVHTKEDENPKFIADEDFLKARDVLPEPNSARQL